MATAWLTGFGDEIDSSLDIQMDVMERLSIHAIELRGVDGRNIAQFTLDEAKTLRTRMKARGFSASALGSPIGKSPITEPFTPVMDSFRQLLEVAQVLEVKAIRMFSFFIPEGEHELWRDEVMTRLSALKNAAAGTGVMLLHENDQRLYGDIPARCLDLANTLADSQFGLIYDPSNFVQVGEMDILAAWEMIRPYVAYYHMKDSRRSKLDPNGEPENPHCIVGTGDGMLRETLTQVANTGFTGFFSVEPHLANSRYVPGTPVEKWIAAAEGLKQLLGECGIAIDRPGA